MIVIILPRESGQAWVNVGNYMLFEAFIEKPFVSTKLFKVPLVLCAAIAIAGVGQRGQLRRRRRWGQALWQGPPR